MVNEDPACGSPIPSIKPKQALTLEDGHKGIRIVLVCKSIPFHSQSHPYEL